MQTATPLSKTDIALMILFALLGVTSLTILKNQDQFISIISASHTNQQRMGKILSFTNDVRKKMVSETHWTSIKDESDIFNKQMIFTSANSRTTIRLENNSEIHLEPESLVLFIKQGARETLELKSGVVSGRFNDLALVHKGKKIKVNSKSSKIKISNEGIKIENLDKEARIYAPRSSLIEKESIISQSIELLASAKRYFLVEGEVVNVELKWHAPKKKNFIIKWYKEGGRNNETLVQKDENQHLLKISETGKYHVFLTDPQTKSNSSSDFVFEVISFPKLKLITPDLEVRL